MAAAAVVEAGLPIASSPLSVQVGDSNDFLPAALAEPAGALKPLGGELAYLLFDVRIVGVVGSVGEKSRSLRVIAGCEVVARLCHERLDIWVIDHVWLDHVASSRC
jgi:hypothetical protein